MIAREPGSFTALVHIEANVSPVEGTTGGTMVFDGAIPNLDIGVLEEEVRIVALNVREGDNIVERIEL